MRWAASACRVRSVAKAPGAMMLTVLPSCPAWSEIPPAPALTRSLHSEMGGKTNLKLLSFVRVYILIRVVIGVYVSKNWTHAEDDPVSPIDAQQQPFRLVISGRSKSWILVFILKIEVLWLDIQADAVW